MSKTVLLGYEIATGAPVEIPVNAHLCVTGQTQLSGKTTTLEALVDRSKRRALAFRTKRGEQAFADAPTILPYFREHADWRFVSSILEATLHERMKFERGWIMRVAKGAQTLADVDRNISEQMKTAKGLSADIYLQLHEYMQIVVPQLKAMSGKLSSAIALKPGLNVMELTDYSPEVQALVISSAVEWIYERESDTTVIFPEAWEILPEGRNSVVKIAAQRLFRKSASVGNYMWLDSQDIAGVWKEALRACSVWILGVQREINEVKRNLAHIPIARPKPKPESIMQLGKGEFFVSLGGELRKVYVQPKWMTPDSAIAIALGDLKVADFAAPVRKAKRSEDENLDYKQAFEEQKARADRLEERVRELELMMRTTIGNKAPRPTPVPEPVPTGNHSADSLEEIWAYVREQLAKDKPLLALASVRPEIAVSVSRRTIAMDDGTLKGRLALLIAKNFFESGRTGNAAFEELKRSGFRTAKPNVYKELDKLAGMGFLTKESDGYRAVPEMKVRILENGEAA